MIMLMVIIVEMMLIVEVVVQLREVQVTEPASVDAPGKMPR